MAALSPGPSAVKKARSQLTQRDSLASDLMRTSRQKGCPNLVASPRTIHKVNDVSGLASPAFVVTEQAFTNL